MCPCSKVTPCPVLGTPVVSTNWRTVCPGVQQELVVPQHRSVYIQRLSLPQAPGQSFPCAESPVLSDFSLPTSGYLNLHYKAAGSKQKCVQAGGRTRAPSWCRTRLLRGCWAQLVQTQTGFSTWKQQCRAQAHSSNLSRIQQHCQLSTLKVSIQQKKQQCSFPFCQYLQVRCKEEPRLVTVGIPLRMSEGRWQAGDTQKAPAAKPSYKMLGTIKSDCSKQNRNTGIYQSLPTALVLVSLCTKKWGNKAPSPQD